MFENKYRDNQGKLTAATNARTKHAMSAAAFEF